MFRLGNPITKRVLITVGLALLIAVVVGYYAANMRVHWQNDRVLWLEQQANSLYQRVDQLEYQKNILQVELDVERNASRALQHELRGVLEDKSNITRELAFYQRVMAPELDARGVTIDSFVVNTVTTPDTYYFRLIILQLERTQQSVRGSFSIILFGQEEEKRVEYSVLELANVGEQEKEFAANYYALSEGTFQLPESFVPQGIKITVKAGKSKPLERVYPWLELLSGQTTLPLNTGTES